MKTKVFFVLFIGLLFVGFTAMAQENPRKKIGRLYEQAARELDEPVQNSLDLVKNFSLAMTPAEVMALTKSEEAENEKVDKATDDTGSTAETAGDEDISCEQKVLVVMPARPGTVLSLEIAGVEFSLAIEPAIYRNPYLYPYGLWYGWSSYWGYGWGYRWRPYYNYSYYGWRNWSSWPRRSSQNINPVHISQLKTPRRTSNTETLTAQNKTANQIQSIKPTSAPQNNQVKSYSGSKIVSRTSQKFNGRISAKYTNPKPNRFLQNSSSALSRTAVNSHNPSRVSMTNRTSTPRSSTPRIFNQSSRLNYSRTTLRRPVQPRTNSSRVSGSARSSAPHTTTVRSSGVSRPSTAARTTSSRPASSRGTAVRKK